MARKEDKCQIEVQGELTLERYASFQMLYYPLIKMDAAALYHTLVAIGTRSQKIKNHILIQSICGHSMDVIEKNRVLLEQYLLVKTFYNASTNTYVYQVYMPMEGSAFLRHEVFGRLYMKEMGKQVYEFNKLSFAHTHVDKSEYQDITMPFVNRLREDWKDTQEEQFKKLKPAVDQLQQNDIPLRFNFDRFLTGLSKTIFPLKARSEKNLRLIGELATIHGIKEIEMRKLVSQSIDLKKNDVNVELLKRKVRNAKSSYIEKENANPYDMPPIHFLQHKQRGIEVSKGDANLIEALIFDFKMKPEVVNVLIEYVLNVKQQQFPKAYVEKIASTWVRLDIDSCEKALAQIDKDTKTVYEKKPKKKNLPNWYIEPENVHVDIKGYDEEELLQDLKELRGE